MSQKYSNVIVFGPTGAVGSNVALEASKRGAKVWLAMRDPKKSINKELDADSYKDNRIQADLSDPASVKKAVETSGATAAFFYAVHGASDHMKAAIQAVKEGGVTYAVFLSSFTIKTKEDPRDITPDRFIPFIHAQVEIILEDLDIDHTALRPGNFASNGLGMWCDKKKTPIEAMSMDPNRVADWIVPADIGKIGGAVLVDRPSSSKKKAIYVYGPELIKYTDMWKMTEEGTGKEIKQLDLDNEEKIQWLTEHGAPPPLAKYIVGQENTPDVDDYYNKELFNEGASSIKKYAGYEPTTFKQFISEQTV